MTNNQSEYYLDKDKTISIMVTKFQNGDIHFSIYNDRNDSSIAYICNRNELKGLADFLYETIGINR